MKNSVLKVFDPPLSALVVTVALLSAVEALVVLGTIAYHIPFKPDPALAEIFFHYRKGFIPEQELALYVTGILLAGSFCVGLIAIFHRYFEQEAFRKALGRYAWAQGFFAVIQVALVYALIINPQHKAAWTGLYSVMGVSLLVKIFYSEINQCFGRTS